MSQDQSSSNSERDIGQETIPTENQKAASVEPVQPEKQHEDVSANTTTPNSKADSTGSGKGNKLKLIVFIVVVILLGLIAYGLWKAYLPKTIELQGRVESETVHISTKVPSRIEEFYVTEGQTVKKGQAVVRFVSPELEAKKEQAQAALQSAMAFHSTVYRGAQQENIDTLYANWQAMKTQAELAATTYKRGENLYQQGVISRQRRDEMLATQTSARETAEASYQQYARAKRGSTEQQKSTADAQVAMAQAAVKEANALDEETKLYSPTDGTVSKTYGKPTELVATGIPVVSIIEDHDLWVSLNVREDMYSSIYKSKTLDGFIPALNRKASFKVKNIDAEGDFATIKTTRQTGGYDIRSFKFHLVPEQSIPDLKVGMSVLFKIEEAK
ncbi:MULTISPECIES: efflux RND transporter periplasmic adaptor subunit [unclassified Acinetobacter]|uniref:HlyD family secretion protein n=1 Tax=unclassified Acinetobacter TaxID=196816 RepID=UPI00244ADA19|nr:MULTISPECIES: efflux RND transporter periplasmic adaptor subunit [unclassified Acinetobacter]MDH0031229.1 efflux RND transporter periplasmic adaptor subunit [Acinetobacter sp. GD04021]MDH0886974.1 efflux RND transporter periplasmic adaptor subunit [Acinetobacter sp. GD03873]MDH1083425.1 efflux RND transporter periplasmic adaptor subunit [Acinetobacter sp. GD03983]MDH2190290.1 efflux RND transporter periplasmic adaptor subunit [Acinetobacter sp. GD03645]MDH2203767.1 efflux RND transporter pe